MRLFLASLLFLNALCPSLLALESPPIADVYKHEILLENSPFPLRLFLFFSREHQKLFEQTKESLFEQLYNDPSVEIYLVLQKKKFSTLIRRKLTKELQKDFKQENDSRQAQLKNKHPSLNTPPGYFMLVDFDGKISKEFHLPPSNAKPIAVFLGPDGKSLAQFDSGQIPECFEWLKSQKTPITEPLQNAP